MFKTNPRFTSFIQIFTYTFIKLKRYSINQHITYFLQIRLNLMSETIERNKYFFKYCYTKCSK